MLSFGYMPDTHGGPYEQPEPSPERSADFAEQLLNEAEIAESAGFDGVFVPERHARTECMFPSPIPLMAAIAARTKPGARLARISSCRRCTIRCIWRNRRR